MGGELQNRVEARLEARIGSVLTAMEDHLHGGLCTWAGGCPHECPGWTELLDQLDAAEQRLFLSRRYTPESSYGGKP